MSCHTEQILSLAEIGQHFADQWVLVRLTDVDKYGSPVKGVVIFHSSDRGYLVKCTRQLHQQNPDVETFTFYTGEQIPEGTVVIL